MNGEMLWQAGNQAESNGNQDFGPLEGGNSAVFGGSGGGSFGGSASGFGGSGGGFGAAPTENGNASHTMVPSHHTLHVCAYMFCYVMSFAQQRRPPLCCALSDTERTLYCALLHVC